MGCSTSRSVSLPLGDGAESLIRLKQKFTRSKSCAPLRSTSERDMSTSCKPMMHYDYHVVALTSSTYGIMKLVTKEKNMIIREDSGSVKIIPVLRDDQKSSGTEEKIKSRREPHDEEAPAETINTWELMEGLDDIVTPRSDSPLQGPMIKLAELAASNELQQLHEAAKKDPADLPKEGKIKLSRSRSLSSIEGLNCGAELELDAGFTSSLTQKPPPGPAKNLMTDLKKNFDFNSHETSLISRSWNRRFSPAATAADHEDDYGITKQVELDNSSLFDPDILASFASSVGTGRNTDQSKTNISNQPVRSVNMIPSAISGLEAAAYERKCPPGGDERVVLYSTSLRGIRKTFQDCNKVRTILQTYVLWIDERDVSMHVEFRKELKDLLLQHELLTGSTALQVPRVFIMGYYIGGVEEVVELHETEKLEYYYSGFAHGPAAESCNNYYYHCNGCGGVRFVPCPNCNGSCKIISAENSSYSNNNKIIRCPDCNENGLIRCPICL
ncbi:unnamed protein product [Sphagnum jensenii]|uniref:Glutaredoxin domain-containing protein n=1 Tax=Sphagnum jensenii TaxID=128206 RepID=A0ABP0ZZE1_9BRYO